MFLSSRNKIYDWNFEMRKILNGPSKFQNPKNSSIILECFFLKFLMAPNFRKKFKDYTGVSIYFITI